MAYYTAECKNVERNSNPKRTSAGRGTIGVSTKIYLDTAAQDVVGIELWLRECMGETKLQVSEIGNGYNTNRSGKMLFDGSIEEFIEAVKKGVA